MSLKKTDVLTIDAIIITGVLILLTISETGESKELIDFVFVTYVKLTILVTILPFSLSAVTEISDAIKNTEQADATKKGLRYMRYGFMYLILLVALITMGQLYPAFRDFIST